MTAETSMILSRPGAVLAYRRVGEGPPLLLLHATLSSSSQLQPLASRLAARYEVISVDRRGGGETALRSTADIQPVDVAVHVEDLAALVEAERLGPCVVVGHSYGGCLGLELAARRPRMVSAVWAFEPPYGPLAPRDMRRDMEALAARTLEANARLGAAAAAEVFMIGVSGRKGLDGLSPSAIERIRGAGASAVADATLLGLDAEGLDDIECPVIIATGSASQPVYAAIGEALRERIRDAVIETIEGADHMAPITHPGVVAAAVAASIER